MRRLLLYIVIITTGVIFIARLFYLQVVDTSFVRLSEDNAIKVVYDYPQRGYIFDRNGKLLVSNQPSYDVMAIPRNVKAFDTAEFCKIIHISKEDLVQKLDRAKVYSPWLPSIIIPQLTKSEYAYLQEKMRNYEGFYIQKRSLRDYQTKHAANVLGYIAEVNNKIIEKNPYYISGDLIGKQGVEGQYEDLLRGIKGVKYIQKDRFNRDMGPYKGGIFDTLPKKGKDLTITIDETLQAYGEKLMKHKHGGIVAIEPGTGEILSLVTAPSYDPALLVGRKRSANFTKLYYDTISKPLYDRGLQAQYPPGSPFKTLNALIALQENVIDTDEVVNCQGGYYYNGRRLMACHEAHGRLSMIMGIAESCNTYFATVYKRVIDKYPTAQEGIDAWNKHVKSFGLGQYLG
ncbi:MAG: penicillin-binding transpeptidase domain-containing protein, partial [Gillisia sp.]